jgi:hypothetical protein
MAKAHVLATQGALTSVIYHIDVPAGTNAAGTSWADCLKNSGTGGTTRLPDGTGAGGTISAAEKTAVTNGTVYEVADSVAIPSGMDAATANAFLDALHAAKVAEIEPQIQQRLDYFGYTRT